MIKLNEIQIKLAEQLLITVIKREPYVEYKELGDRVTPPLYHRQVPKNIGEVSRLCYELGLPFLSAKVVTKGVNVAGEGFYNLYLEYFPEAKELTPKQVFKEECKRIRECTQWYKLADYLHIDIDLPRPALKNDDVKPSVRILPMSRQEEFPGMSIEEVQKDYFLGDFINSHNGIYYFRKAGMNAAEGSLILFQFDNMIIASAKLLNIEKYEEPVEKQYYGAYEFDVESVKVFQPISLKEINQIDASITSFSQAKQEINSLYKSEIEELIEKKQTPIMAEELTGNECNKLKEGAKKQVLVNAYERNYKARQECIDHYGSVCCICGFDFAKFYGNEFEGKIHVHHLKALAEINEEYEVDPIYDLRPVCPNCHLALHSKVGDKPYDIDELKAKILNKNNGRLNKAIELANRAHAGQVDKAGQPYILHPLRVMLSRDNELERICAVLHDVVEDSDITFDDLRKEGFSEEVIAVMDCITKRDDENYDTFIGRVLTNETACKVKLADLLDNMNLTRIENPTEKDIERIKKYKDASERIFDVLPLKDGIENERVIKIDGCVSIDPFMTQDEFLVRFIRFVENHGWYFGGGVEDITDKE